MRILLIDDDEELMEVLAQKLIEQHYAVDIANTGEMGWEFILIFNYELVVLDLMLPDVDGIQLCQKIRNKGYKMPILLLTASDRHTDKIRGLDSGADDYVVKPFDFDELTARIRALLRREIHDSSPILKRQGLSLDPRSYEVTYDNELLPLTPKEYALLELFMRYPQQVFSPAAIIDNLWAGEDPPGEEAVRTHVKGLRQKLKAVGMAKDTIKTVYGIGYRLKADNDKISYKQKNAKLNQSSKINFAWSKFRDVAFQRLAILENLAVALAENKATPELQTQAKSSAHKLAGSLGGFGFPEGSKIAKQIENILDNNLVEKANTKLFTKLTASLNCELQHKPFEETVRNRLSSNISLLIIENNHDFGQQLVREAHKKKIKTFTASNLEQAKKLIQRESLAAVVYKIVFPDGEDLAFLEQLHRDKPQLPIISIIEDAQFLDRLGVVRKGCNLVLEYPVNPSIVITSVTELIQNTGGSAKVLVVDDDPQVLLSLEISLEPWGFQLTTLDQPGEFWNTLEEVEPDILVLDIEMPQINGIELCQILRCDRRWQQLPVLFLTVHQDEKTQHQAFAIGADDYIVKPVVASELASRIINRLQRVSAIRQ